MTCTLKDPHDCATVRQANDALRRHLDRACRDRDAARTAALEEVADLCGLNAERATSDAGHVMARHIESRVRALIRKECDHLLLPGNGTCVRCGMTTDGGAP